MAISESLAPSMDLWLMLADPMMMYSSSTEIKQKNVTISINKWTPFKPSKRGNSSRIQPFNILLQIVTVYLELFLLI
jgi:hypothetical protein